MFFVMNTSRWSEIVSVRVCAKKRQHFLMIASSRFHGRLCSSLKRDEGSHVRHRNIRILLRLMHTIMNSLLIFFFRCLSIRSRQHLDLLRMVSSLSRSTPQVEVSKQSSRHGQPASSRASPAHSAGNHTPRLIVLLPCPFGHSLAK